MACACPLYNWGMSYTRSDYSFNSITDIDYIKSFSRNSTLYPMKNSLRSILLMEIEKMYSDLQCQNWIEKLKHDYIDIKYKSYLQIKEFVHYIDKIELVPSIIPYANNCLGLEWNTKNKIISVMFKENNTFIYSIITDDLNEYGENNQTKINQLNFINRIYGILKSV